MRGLLGWVGVGLVVAVVLGDLLVMVPLAPGAGLLWLGVCLLLGVLGLGVGRLEEALAGVTILFRPGGGTGDEPVEGIHRRIGGLLTLRRVLLAGGGFLVLLGLARWGGLAPHPELTGPLLVELLTWVLLSLITAEGVVHSAVVRWRGVLQERGGPGEPPGEVADDPAGWEWVGALLFPVLLVLLVMAVL